jgi:hypothetical protein
MAKAFLLPVLGRGRDITLLVTTDNRHSYVDIVSAVADVICGFVVCSCSWTSTSDIACLVAAVMWACTAAAVLITRIPAHRPPPSLAPLARPFLGPPPGPTAARDLQLASAAVCCVRRDEKALTRSRRSLVSGASVSAAA